jgi:hypothetical protein
MAMVCAGKGVRTSPSMRGETASSNWYGDGFAEENERTRGKKEKMGDAES